MKNLKKIKEYNYSQETDTWKNDPGSIRKPSLKRLLFSVLVIFIFAGFIIGLMIILRFASKRGS